MEKGGAPLRYVYLPQDNPNYERMIVAVGGQISQDIEQCEGLILPGGGDINPAWYGQSPCWEYPWNNQNDQQDFQLFSQFYQRDLPILGICRGAQIMAVALGGTLFQYMEHHSQVSGQDGVHETRLAGYMAKLYGSYLVVNSAHHQAVDYLPKSCHITQLSLDGIIEGFAHNTRPLFAVQWHPERHPQGHLVFAHFLQSQIGGPPT